MAAAGTLSLAGPAHGAAEDTVWLCKPGVQPNPCVGSLETTYVSSSGESRVETATNAPNPRVDCFYVYPTVSDQQGPNSDRRIEPQQTAIAQYQAARFSRDLPRVRARSTASAPCRPSSGLPANEERAFQVAYARRARPPGASTWPATTAAAAWC